ncbi:PAS domain S-box protein [Dongia soli]|uniref:Adenylate/guanylate cyclase domain-containing protein n=1 Tax=Dongia soli TaxID=600628 RepID=A0ABU5EES3_9PROT|nr:adenylate/guanylate cyclase domain-containing protein [Dongia soli]MDY0884437.1 adenylate/guanylate cyclase domain-containing protein [Dongia soli]
MTVVLATHAINHETPLDELARRTAMLDAVGYAATKIIGNENWSAGIQELLNRLGHATDVNRVTLFEIHPSPDGRPAESCRYDWASPGLARLSDDPRYHNILLTEAEGQLSAWAEARMRGEIVQATLSSVTGETRQTFIEHGTQAFISVPIMLQSGVWGFLGLDDCRWERQWSALHIDVLKTAAALIAGAIDRSQVNEALRLSRERYALAARGANDGLWDWNLKESTIYCAPRLHEILHLSILIPEHAPDMLFSCFLKEDWHAVIANLDHCIATGEQQFRFEARVKDAMAKVHWIVARGLIIYDHGKATRIVGSMRDITDFKAAELSLQIGEARVRAILDTAFDAIITTEADGCIVEYNLAASKIFGYGREEVLGRSIGALISSPLCSDPAMPARLYADLATTVDRLIEAEGCRADSSRVPVELSVTEVALPEERLFTFVIRDISHRKRLEAQLAAVQLQRAQLARHFSPNMVEELILAGDATGLAREQPIAVLFADIYGYTELVAAMPGEKIIDLLRDFRKLVETAVFAQNGTIDKYIGDGLMATFGTPYVGKTDATNAIIAAQHMARALKEWNGRRAVAGEPCIQIGIGLNYGPATLGNIGTEQRLEFAVVGDTVNMASRIENISRVVQHAIVASDDLIRRAMQESGAMILVGFTDLGEHSIRGRRKPIRLWGIAADTLM